MKFSEVLKQRRREVQLTQEALAQKLGIAAAIVNAWEAGQKYPAVQTLLELASLLDVSLESLIGQDKQVMKAIDNQLLTAVKKRKRKKKFIVLVSVIAIAMGLIVVYHMPVTPNINFVKEAINSDATVEPFNKKEIKDVFIKDSQIYVVLAASMNAELCGYSAAFDSEAKSLRIGMYKHKDGEVKADLLPNFMSLYDNCFSIDLTEFPNLQTIDINYQ